MSIVEQIAEKAERLSPAHQQEALDFIEFLLEKSARSIAVEERRNGERKLSCSWRGALSELKEQYRTSVELQKKAMDWRIGLE